MTKAGFLYNLKKPTKKEPNFRFDPFFGIINIYSIFWLTHYIHRHGQNLSLSFSLPLCLPPFFPTPLYIFLLAHFGF